MFSGNRILFHQYLNDYIINYYHQYFFAVVRMINFKYFSVYYHFDLFTIIFGAIPTDNKVSPFNSVMKSSSFILHHTYKYCPALVQLISFPSYPHQVIPKSTIVVVSDSRRDSFPNISLWWRYPIVSPYIYHKSLSQQTSISQTCSFIRAILQ